MANQALDKLPITTLNGVGPRIAEHLERLGVHSVQDMLFHLPSRYQDRTHVAPIGTLRPGAAAGVVATIDLTQVKFGRRRSLLCAVSDGSGKLLLRFFHFSSAQQRNLARGARIHCFGEVRGGPTGLEMVHPEYRLLTEDEPVKVEEHLTAIYPTTEGLHQIMLRKLARQAVMLLGAGQTIAECLPEQALRDLNLPSLENALLTVHQPSPDTPVDTLEDARHPAVKRLVFEELLAQHLSRRLVRREIDKQPAHRMGATGSLGRRLVAQLPYQLTSAQQRVTKEIADDLKRDRPMMRLVHGDVGSGKTLVAALAASQVIESGFQVAIMAPTELLAEQHFKNFDAWLTPLGIHTVWLVGKLTGKTRVQTLAKIRDGDTQAIVGTHALFQDDVRFKDLALIIVDEQHRFGVHQRLALRSKGADEGLYPHQLIMTATPIPRTLEMTAYADLDCSVIDELPPGRQAIETAVVPSTRRPEVIERVREACSSGRQAYWVCTLIDESDAIQCKAALEIAEHLRDALPKLGIGLVHGRLKSAEKDAAMSAFKDGKLDVLVATTVIEVGVDVPNATLMIIENAERLGLAQLHQLRGRIGRGSKKSACVLMYQSPLSEHARARLHVLRETGDGFEIAQRDLELRGPGEVLGTRQTGMAQLRIADFTRDRALLPMVRRTANTMLGGNPRQVAALVQRWVGHAVDYAGV